MLGANPFRTGTSLDPSPSANLVGRRGFFIVNVAADPRLIGPAFELMIVMTFRHFAY